MKDYMLPVIMIIYDTRVSAAFHFSLLIFPLSICNTDSNATLPIHVAECFLPLISAIVFASHSRS